MVFSDWLASVWALPGVQTLAWAVVAGGIGLLWGLSEIIGAFRNETGRALRTSGAWLLILLNFGASAVIYLVATSLLAGGDSWWTAVMVGLAWPTVIRNLSFKLAQPLQSEEVSAVATVRIEQAYAAVQALARQLINASLARQRMKLVDQALELDLSVMEKRARLAVISAPLTADSGGPPEEFINRIMARPDEDDIKKALLAVFILQTFDRAILEDMLKAKR